MFSEIENYQKTDLIQYEKIISCLGLVIRPPGFESCICYLLTM